MQGLLLIAVLGVWWFTTWWVALTLYLIGSLWAHLLNARRLHRQLIVAFAIINEHAKELRIRRKQLTVQQSYGLIDDSKWQTERNIFASGVIEPVTGSLDDNKTRQAVEHAINRVTRNFASSSTPFHPGMDPLQYEALVADLLRDFGWATRLTKGSGDQGIDVIAEMRGKKVVIQCKLYSSTVGNAAVQEAIAGMRFEDANFAAVVSNSTFTQSAKQLATKTGVLLLHHVSTPI
jgi:restriction system protein